MLYWARDLLLSVVIAIIVILFLYQPVRFGRHEHDAALDDQERISSTSLSIVSTLARLNAATWLCSGSRATRQIPISSAKSARLETLSGWITAW